MLILWQAHPGFRAEAPAPSWRPQFAVPARPTPPRQDAVAIIRTIEVRAEAGQISASVDLSEDDRIALLLAIQ